MRIEDLATICETLDLLKRIREIEGFKNVGTVNPVGYYRLINLSTRYAETGSSMNDVTGSVAQREYGYPIKVVLEF